MKAERVVLDTNVLISAALRAAARRGGRGAIGERKPVRRAMLQTETPQGSGFPLSRE